MAGKFMKLKKIVIPVMALIILTSQLAGCATFSSKEMLNMLDSGESVTIELAQPDYKISVLGTQESSTDWVQLDSLKTYNDFRMSFDTLLNINKITTNGVNSKSGSLYVDKNNNQVGNSTLENAFRNKVFVTQYWDNADVGKQITQLAPSAYTDEDGASKSSLYASLNAYFDLLTDNTDPSSFNATQSVTREQFYSMVFKSTNGVKALTSDSNYTDATGGSTEYSIYAQQVQEYAFLNTKDNCLDENNVNGSISRAEAVYMVVNEFFADQLKAVSSKDSAYSDCKNAGDLALKLDFKEKKDGKVTGKDNWQSYVLAYMMQNPSKGMQEDLYKAMVVAYENGLLGTDETSRWDEPISKSESIELMKNVFLALDKLEGYLSDTEYGNYAESDTTSNKSDGTVVIDDTVLPLSSGTLLSSGITLGEAASLINDMIKDEKALGHTDAEIRENLAGVASDFGTTMNTIESYNETEKLQQVAVKEVSTSKSTSGSKKTSDSQTKTSGNSVASSGDAYAGDKNHNGINDAFEGCLVSHEDAAGGTSQSTGNPFVAN